MCIPAIVNSGLGLSVKKLRIMLKMTMMRTKVATKVVTLPEKTPPPDVRNASALISLPKTAGHALRILWGR